MEYPWRLLRLRELRLRRVLCARRLFDRRHSPVPPLPIPVLVVSAALSGFVGFGMGYLTLRLRGAFFAIATLALAVVLETLVVNWDFVGGSRGAYIVRPESSPRSAAISNICS